MKGIIISVTKILINFILGLLVLYYVVPYSIHLVDITQRSEVILEEIKKVGIEMDLREENDNIPSQNQIKNRKKIDDVTRDNSNIKLSQTRKFIVNTALKYIGTPYVWAGDDPSGFDCSGFTKYVYNESIGFVIPRHSYDQYLAGYGVKVEKKGLESGDLIFFITKGNRVSHVGIYVGKNKFIHAPSTGNLVRIDNLNNYYWSRRFVCGKKFV